MSKQNREIKGVTMINCSICREDYAIAIPKRVPWSDDIQPPVTSGVCDKCQKIIDTKFCWLLCEDEQSKPQMAAYTKYETAWAVLHKSPNAVEVLKAGDARISMEVWSAIGLPLEEINNT